MLAVFARIALKFMGNINKVAVVGAGAWGTSLSIILSKNVGEVSVWAREPEIVASVNSQRLNKMFLPQVKVPEKVFFSGDAGEVLDGACRLNSWPLRQGSFRRL